MDMDIIQMFEKEEPLCDELLFYYSNDGKFPRVQHPLVYSVPHHNQYNALLNYQLKERIKRRDSLLGEGDYEGYVFVHEKPFRLNAFLMIADSIKEDARYWELLGEVWVNSENIWQNIRDWKRALKSNRADKHKFMSEKDYEVYQNLPEDITVYRGYAPEGTKYGMSFTLSLEQATWFATRWKAQGMVFRKQIKKDDVFAYINSRNEQEIIIL